MKFSLSSIRMLFFIIFCCHVNLIKTMSKEQKIVPVLCTICLGEIKNNKSILPCEHAFHTLCIWEWALEKLTCPLCRHAMDLKITPEQLKTISELDIKQLLLKGNQETTIPAKHLITLPAPVLKKVLMLLGGITFTEETIEKEPTIDDFSGDDEPENIEPNLELERPLLFGQKTYGSFFCFMGYAIYSWYYTNDILLLQSCCGLALAMLLANAE